MVQFIQVHALVSYPPSNPNRDDLNRPKTAIFGGSTRQRMSSQALKRAWRLGEFFKVLDDSISTRTRRLGRGAFDSLVQKGIAEKLAMEWANMIAAVFGKVEGEIDTKEIVVLGPEEIQAVDDLVETVAKRKTKPTEEELNSLQRKTTALDVAMFGRMRADAKEVNADAAVQVAHAITTNQVRVEADYWTAVDDLNAAGESGAGGIGEREFGSGVYYLYACIDVPALAANLGGDTGKAARGIEALVRSIAMIVPRGHQSSFANRALAQYLRIEIGSAQPRALVGAFEKAVEGGRSGLTRESIEVLEAHATDMERAYGPLYDRVAVLDVPGRRGSLDEIVTTLRAALA